MPESECGYDNLIAGPGVFRTVPVIVKAGTGVIRRGMVLGVVKQLSNDEGRLRSGEYLVRPVDSTSSDGSQYPFAILEDLEVDATNYNVRATGYVSGEFNRAALVFGGNDTVATHEEALRKIGIITKRVIVR
ncbi:head decoration protein [Paenibacillus chibensis]|uniref:Head decoration protein n=1 Tax=Paenibacillus chibensis TaxID=59846 RepID=A0ABU6PNH5_9BACL|nr:head decoration protein [Paenibacillus chibensis]